MKLTVTTPLLVLRGSGVTFTMSTPRSETLTVLTAVLLSLVPSLTTTSILRWTVAVLVVLNLMASIAVWKSAIEAGPVKVITLPVMLEVMPPGKAPAMDKTSRV